MTTIPRLQRPVSTERTLREWCRATTPNSVGPESGHTTEPAATNRRRRRRPPIGEFALHTISIPRSAMNVLTGQLRVHHHAPRFRGGLCSQSGGVTENFPSLHSLTRRSVRSNEITGMAPVEMRTRERLVRAIAGMSTVVERPFLIGAFLLSLAAPPTGTPLRGRSAFRSSLEGIPPTVPSFQPAPPPFDERAIPLATLRSTLRDGADRRHPSGAADLTVRLGLGSA